MAPDQASAKYYPPTLDGNRSMAAKREPAFGPLKLEPLGGWTQESEGPDQTALAPDAPVTHSRGMVTTRESVLDEAKGLITGDRNNTYGPPHQDFQRSASAATAYGYRGPDGRELQAHDIAILVSLVKISRLMWTPGKRDSWVDMAGYAACGYECVVEAEKTEAL